MLFGFGKRKKRDLHQQAKMEESQRVLLSAATETANAAQSVTTLLKARLDDALKQFEGTARILNDGLFVCDLNGTIKTSNPAARHMFNEPSLVERSVLELFDLDGSRVSSAEELWNLIRSTSCWTSRSDHPLKGRQAGTDALFWIEPICAPIDWSDGTASMILLVRNTQSVVMLQESAADARNKFNSIFEGSFDGILIEQNDCIVAANSSVADLFGYTTAELLNRPVAILFVPDDHARVEANLDRCNFTVHGVHASGSLRSLIFTAAVITWKGETARMITVKNVTDVQHLEELASSRRDNGIDMICCFSPDYLITFANKAFAIENGTSRENLVGQDIRQYLGFQDSTSFEEGVGSLSVANSSKRTQTSCPNRDGIPLVQDWIDHAVFDSDGRAVEFQRVGREISLAMLDTRQI